MASLIFMLGMGILGAASGGANSSAQQAAIKNQVCQTAKAAQTYSQTMETDMELLQNEDNNVKSNILTMQTQISSSKNYLDSLHASFRQKYNLFLILGLIFILIIIFLLATKKFILMKAKMNQTKK